MEYFTWKPDRVITQTSRFRTLITGFESGTEQRRAKWSTPLHTFSLTFALRKERIIKEIWDFYVARGGAAEAFYFTTHAQWLEPSHTYTVRFAEDELTMESITEDLYKTGLRLQEVR